MIINPAKLGISVMGSVVLLIGGVIILNQSQQPKLSLQDRKAISASVETPEVSTASAQDSETSDHGEVESAQQASTIDDKIDVDTVQVSMEQFDPISSGDWSLDKLNDYVLEISR